MELGRVGLWTRQLDNQPASAAEAAVLEAESLGYRSIWIPEVSHREVLTFATLLLAATSSIAVATGIARVHARSPTSAALAQQLLAERFPNRFLLGLGVSHPLVVERVLGQTYGPPLATMSAYLDAMPKGPVGWKAVEDGAPTVLAALGPKMLALAADRTAGAHTYLAPVAHTAWARGQLGPDALLAPAIKAVLTTDRAAGNVVARSAVKPTTSLPAYRRNLQRFGYSDSDLDGELSDRLIEALVVVGDEHAIEGRVREHLDAGADHVAVEVLAADERSVPLAAWRALAPALTQIAEG